MPNLVTFRGLIKNLRRASPSVSCGSPPRWAKFTPNVPVLLNTFFFLCILYTDVLYQTQRQPLSSFSRMCNVFFLFLFTSRSVVDNYRDSLEGYERQGRNFSLSICLRETWRKKRPTRGGV